MEVIENAPKPSAISYVQKIGKRAESFLVRLSTRLKLLGEVAMTNLFTIVLLIFIYLFYWTFPQAKDLLLTINQENHLQIVLFFTSLITLAGISWYLPRYFYEENRSQFTHLSSWKKIFDTDPGYANGYSAAYTPAEADTYPRHFREMMPRVLAASLLFLVTLGILNVGNEIDPAGFPWSISAYRVMAVLGGAILLILLLENGSEPVFFRLNFWLRDNVGGRVTYYFGFVGLVLAGLMFTKQGDFNDLKFLLLAAFLISFSFLIFTICRRWMPFFKHHNNISYPLATLAVLLSAVFVLINVFPSLSQRMNPLVCANLAFVFYLTVLYLTRILGMRKRIFTVLFLLTGIFVCAGVTNSFRHHEINYINKSYNPGKRLTMEDYFRQWENQRREVIQNYLISHPNDSFPIVIVSAEGGGSRAAFWTSRVHGYLEQNIPGYYQNHLFALTGASGGSTGNSTFFAMKQGDVSPGRMQAVSSEMFRENYLSSSLTLLLGADLIKDILGLSFGSDRGRQLEDEWRNKLASLLENGKTNAFCKPYMSFWYGGKGNMQLNQDVGPLLFYNMTRVQGGGHAIVSPVKINESAYRGIDLLDSMYKQHPDLTLPFISANLLNASFPYINPAGHIKGVGSFVDAGYFDNYGARTASCVLKELAAIRESDTTFRRIKLISVLVRNGTVDQVLSDAEPVPSNQLLAPVSTLGNLRSAINDHNLWELQNRADDFYSIDLRKVPVMQSGKAVTPIIPLARYLSSLAITAMETSLENMGNNDHSELCRLVRSLQ
ncbi:MAG: hypothetical protein R3C61_12940 [Bacteroidia bacterium]